MLITLANPKIQKSIKQGYLTGGLHLAHHATSGYNVCPHATKGCIEHCLGKQGRGKFAKTQEARIRRTRLFFEDRRAFKIALYRDLLSLVTKAKAMGLKPCFRPNLTSDIAWEIEEKGSVLVPDPPGGAAGFTYSTPVWGS